MAQPPNGWMPVATDPTGWTPVEQSTADPVSAINASPTAISPAMQTARAVWPKAAEVAAEVATNPNVPKVGSQIGRVIGGVAPIVGGAAKAGPGGAAIGVAGASAGAWAGGKTGWFTAKLAQQLGVPVATAMEKLTPLVETLSRVVGPQALLDLLQVAEPNRKDIGFMGMGTTDPNAPKMGSKLLASEFKAYADLLKSGKTPMDAFKMIEQQRSGQ